MSRPLRVQAVEHAKRFLGVKEHPPGSNRGPEIDQWQRRTNGVVGYPWCAAFVTCMLEDVGLKVAVPGSALVENWDRWAQAHGAIVARPFRGDVVCFDWDRDDWSDHIGFVDRVLALRWSRGKRFVGLIRTIEGNTSTDAKGDQSNGGCVATKMRWVNDKTVFVRLPDTLAV